MLLILQLEYEENQELFMPMLMCVTGEFGLGRGVVVWVFGFHRHLFTVSYRFIMPGATSVVTWCRVQTELGGPHGLSTHLSLRVISCSLQCVLPVFETATRCTISSAAKLSTP